MEEYTPDIKNIQSVTLSSPVENLQVFNPLFRSFLSPEKMENSKNTLRPIFEIQTLDLIRETRPPHTVYKRPVHIKYSPLLDPLRYMIGHYDKEPEMDKHICFADDYPIHPTKYKDLNNASYVDSFFCFLSSKLLHGYELQHGIDFYGCYAGIQQEFSIDILDDYEYLEGYDGFRRRLKSGEVVCPDYDLLQKLHSIGSNNNSRGCKRQIQFEKEPVLEEINTLLDIQDMGEPFNNTDTTSNEPNEEMVLEYEKEPVDEDSDTEWEDVSEHSDGSQEENSNIRLKITKMDDDDSSQGTPEDSEENSDSGTEKSDEEENKDREENEEEDDQGNSTENGSEEEEDDEEEEEEDDDEKMMAVIKNFPVQLICLEKCVGTLDSIFCHDDINSDVCMAFAFQIVATLAAYQKAYSFTHNDLHTNNIVYCHTNHTYLYYRLFGKTYRVPTYGKIMKIIDFGRSVYRFQDRKMMSDGFSPSGDAYTQYNTEPYYNPRKPRIEENPSFDLCRLGCSIYDFIFDAEKEMPVEKMDAFQKMVHRWCLDDEGKSVLYKKNGRERFPNFKLYKMIARIVHQHTPENQMPDFEMFLHEEGCDVPRDETGKVPFIDIDQIPALYW